jgi:hypothetical protein
MMAGPPISGTTTAASSVAAGLAITVCAPVRGTITHSYAGGWRSLAGPRR